MLPLLLLSSFLQVPPFLSQLEGRPSPPASPADAPEDWLLAFVDVETTGLLPGYHEMIDIGMILTDVEGREIDRLFLRLQPQHPERTSEGARAVNAFEPDRWRELGALSPKDAVERIASFHHRAAGGREVLLVAYNSHFDAAFLDHLFRGQGRTWRELYHYFVLDLPSMAWSLGLRHLDGSALTRSARDRRRAPCRGGPHRDHRRRGQRPGLPGSSGAASSALTPDVLASILFPRRSPWVFCARSGSERIRMSSGWPRRSERRQRPPS